MTVDPLSLEGIDRIPDPAAHVARAPTPPAVLPDEPSATRAARRSHARVAIGGAIAWIAASVAAFGVRRDIASPLVVAPLVAWSATMLLALSLLLRPRDRGLPAGIRVVQHALWIVPAIYVVGVLVVSASPGDPPLTWSTIRACLCIANLAAAGPLVAAAIFLRGSFLSGAAWRGAAVGAIAGLGGSLGVHAHCAIASMDHLLAAHGPSILVGAALGAIFGRMRGSA